MKILYLHQYFTKPEQGGAIRSFHLAKALAVAGHEVILISSHNEGHEKAETVEGFTVYYLPVYYDNSLGFRGRIWSFIKFAFKAYHRAKKIPGIDICYAASTPLTIGIPALLLKLRHHIPYYFEVGDLWPEAPIQMGVIKNPVLKKILYGLEKKIYKEADKIIPVSPGMGEGVEKVIKNKSVTIIPNLADCHFFKPVLKDEFLIKEHKLENKFVITYFGAVGKSNHLEYFIEIAKACKEKGLDRIKFLLAGKGAELQHIEALAAKHGLDNLLFLGFRDKEGIKKILSMSDATYTSFAKIPVLQTNSPNKFFDSLASGKLSIVNTSAWLKDLVEKNECGFYADPENPQEFISKIVPFLSDKELLEKYKMNARTLAEKEFSVEVLTKKFTELFRSILPLVYNETP
jgi:glycosyltransferase involved in cell wall biosynthesis